jgi:pimeloyl-ACP methyl ester carboxylesterase
MIRALNAQIYGEATSHPALLIVHGLFGSGRNWRAIAKRLSADRRVITIDMRNHAGSFWDADHSYHDLADDLAQTMTQIKGPVDIMAHSMGGKAAMVLASRNPPDLNRIIIVDIAPIAYSHSQITNIDVMRGLDITNITRRSEVDKMLCDQIPDPATRAFLAQSLDLSENGNRWTLNLDALADNMEHIIGFPDISGVFPNEVLFIKGGLSEYIRPEYMPKINRLFPKASVQEIAGSGHWVHAEAPRRFIEVVTGFLANCTNT